MVLKPVVPGDQYFVYVKYSETKVANASTLPTEVNFDFAFLLPNATMANMSSEISYELAYTAFMPVESLQNESTYYVGVKLASSF